jgi:hypothetical protein
MQINRLKKNYKAINLTLLLLCVYVITYPLWSFLLSKFLPQLTKCVFYQVTGRPCPFCGSTTYLKNFWLYGINLDTICDFKTVILGFLIINIIFRCRSIICSYKKINVIIIFDISLMLLMLVSLIIHIIIYFIRW